MTATTSGDSPDLARSLGLYLLMGALLLGTLWSGGYFPTPKLIVAVLLVAAAAWELLFAVADGQRLLPRSPAFWVFGAFTVWAVASLSWSYSPDGAGLEALLLVGYLGVFFTVRSQLMRYGHRAGGILLNWMVYVATFVSAWGIFTYLLRVTPYVNLVDGFLRVGSTFEYSNAMSCFGLMALPLTLALFLDGKRQERPLYATAASIQTAAVALAFSRLGLVMLVAVMLYFLIVAGRRRLFLETLLILAAGLLLAVTALVLGEAEFGKTAVAAAVALTALAWAGQTYAGTGRGRARLQRSGVAAAAAAGLAAIGLVALSGRARQILSLRFGEGFSAEKLLPHRQYTWEAAWRAWQERPVRGWGLGVFSRIFAEFQTAHFTRFAHNLVLQMAVDTGIVGAGLITLFLGYVAALCVWSLLGQGELTKQALAIGAMAFILYNMFDWEWYVPALSAWFMLVVACLEAPAAGGDKIAAQGSDTNTQGG